jgi:hypothetical protein
VITERCDNEEREFAPEVMKGTASKFIEMLNLPKPSSDFPLRVVRPIQIYIFLLVVLSAVTWSSTLYARYFLHRVYPFNTPLFYPPDRYSDWTNFTLRVSHYGEGDMLSRKDLGLPYPYPLPSLYIYLIFVRLFHNSLRAYKIATISIFLVGASILSAKVRCITHHILPQVAIWLTLFLGFPSLTLYDRGNIEVFIWLFIVLGMLAYICEWKYVSVLCFALAASMKIYPGIFLLLFIPRRQYKALIVGLVAMAALSVSSMLAAGPSIRFTLKQMSISAKVLKDVQIAALDEDSLRFDHSILAEAKQAYYAYLHLSHRVNRSHPPTFKKLVRVYSFVAPVGFIALYILFLRSMPLLNQFMALTLCAVLLPYVSYEYTLVHVYLMFGVFLIFLLTDVSSDKVSISRKKAMLMMSCFAIVFAPISILELTHVSGQIKGVILLILLGVILDTPMPSTLFGDLPPSVTEA